MANIPYDPFTPLSREEALADARSLGHKMDIKDLEGSPYGKRHIEATCTHCGRRYRHIEYSNGDQRAKGSALWSECNTRY